MAALMPKPRSFSVVYTNDPFSKPQGLGVIDRLKEKGFTILDTFELPFQLQDVSAVLTAVREKQPDVVMRSEEHTSELQSLMRISYAVFCLKKKHTDKTPTQKNQTMDLYNIT